MSDLQSNPGCLGRLLQLLAGGGAAGKGGEGPWPYRRKKYLLSRAEFSFFRVLQGVASEASGGEWVVCPKVNLNDLLYLEKGTENRMAWLNKINRKHADYVLCDAQTMQPVMIVELDDASHQSASAQKRDADKDRACAAAGLPLVRVRAARAYDPAALAEQLASTLAG